MAKKSLDEYFDGVKAFGRLTILGEATGKLVPSTGNYRRMVDVRCDCGTEKTVDATSLKSGKTKSCGCWNAEVAAQRSRSHGHSVGGVRTPEYTAWKSAKARCFIKTVSNYDQYGGRGITMCQEWKHSFEAFFDYMGPRPSGRHSLDRIDANGNYEPGNCRWATAERQSRNRTTALMLTYKGREYNCSEAAVKFGIKPHTLAKRLRDGWPHDKAIEAPLQPGRKATF